MQYTNVARLLLDSQLECGPMPNVMAALPIYTMCGSMVGIQSATAENRRGEEDRKKKEETAGWKYNVRICYEGRS